MKRPKTLKAAKNRAWRVISRYIRHKAAVAAGSEYIKCVTCDRRQLWNDPQTHCGHFQHGLTYGRDADGKLFVWEENLWPQCVICNTYRNGMLDRYCIFMIETYKQPFVDNLIIERSRVLKPKPTIDEYWEIEKEYAQRLEDSC